MNTNIMNTNTKITKNTNINGEYQTNMPSINGLHRPKQYCVNIQKLLFKEYKPRWGRLIKITSECFKKVFIFEITIVGMLSL